MWSASHLSVAVVAVLAGASVACASPAPATAVAGRQVTCGAPRGAIPDDGLDDSAAIQAALDGRGEVCLGPGTWTLRPGSGHYNPSVTVRSGQILRGIGTATVLDMAGDAGRRSWAGVVLTGDRPTLTKLTVTTTATNHSREQHHLIQVTGPSSGPVIRDLVARDGRGGDCIRLLGRPKLEPGTDVRGVVVESVLLQRCARSGVAFQRGVHGARISAMIVEDTLDDSDIDMEPTERRGTLVPTISDVVIERCTFRRRVENRTQAITISGHGDARAVDITFANNVLEGGNIGVVDVAKVKIVNNLIEGHPGLEAPAISIFRRADDVTVEQNTITTAAPGGTAIAVWGHKQFAPQRATIERNRINLLSAHSLGIKVWSAYAVDIGDNEIAFASATDQSVGIEVRAAGHDVGAIDIRDNDVSATSGSMQAGVRVVAAPKNVGDVSIRGGRVAGARFALQCAAWKGGTFSEPIVRGEQQTALVDAATDCATTPVAAPRQPRAKRPVRTLRIGATLKIGP